jgi:hypothetical protein
MKGQNCEARFSYRGFATATTKAEIVQNSLVVAQLTLTPSTDPRIASINFPCGDLANATTFRIAQTTANMTGTNEIGAIYTGLATNMANVAQAELIGTLRNYGTNCIWTGAGTSAMAADTDCSTYTKEGLDLAPTTRVPAITFTAPKSGNYAIGVQVYAGAPSVTTYQCQIYQNGVLKNNVQSNYTSTGASQNENRAYVQFNADLTSGTAYTFDVRCTTSALLISRSVEESLYWTVYRFPTSSELVVTPERQNTFAGVVHTSGTQALHSGSAEPTTFSSYNNATWNQPSRLKGKAAVTTTNSGNDLGFSVPNLPVGNYEMKISGAINTVTGGSGVYSICNFRVRETTTDSTVIAYQHNGESTPGTGTRDYVTSGVGMFTNNSVATRNFIVEASKFADTTATNNSSCEIFTSSSPTGASYNTYVTITLTPLDQPSNSALYVQGPVLGAQTGAAIPTSYVGEELFAADATYQNTTSATYNTLSLALTPGVWDVSGLCRFDKSGATFTDPNFIASITNQNTNPFETVLAQLSGSSYINSNTVGLVTPIVRVRWDGVTNITYGSNNTSSNLVYIRCFPGTFTSGPVGILRRVRAIRVN